MAERSKALRSGRSLVLQAWVRIPLLTNRFVIHGPDCFGARLSSAKQNTQKHFFGAVLTGRKHR